MAGVDKITEEILQEAKSAAQALLSETEDKAKEIAGAAAKEAQSIVSSGEEAAKQIIAQQEERTKSSVIMRKRQTLLTAKQEVIDSVLQQAYDKLAGQDGTDYFKMIETLLKKNIHAGDGQLCLPEKDLKRLPEGFAQAVSEAAKAAGGNLTISEIPAKIANGFILKYGGVEENCSLDALFAQARETLRDQVSSILW